jgi:CubicO group peptidase (beta-lactamase class C family)
VTIGQLSATSAPHPKKKLAENEACEQMLAMVRTADAADALARLPPGSTMRAERMPPGGKGGMDQGKGKGKGTGKGHGHGHSQRHSKSHGHGHGHGHGGSAASGRWRQQRTAELDALRRAVHAVGAPAVAVAVVARGEMVFHCAAGEAGGGGAAAAGGIAAAAAHASASRPPPRRSPSPCDAERTVFLAASITKTLVAALAAQCVERGELDLDADVSDAYLLPGGLDAVRSAHFPGVPLTCRALLTHRAGLRDDEAGLRRGSPYRAEGADWGGGGLREYARRRFGGAAAADRAALLSVEASGAAAAAAAALWCDSEEASVGAAPYHYSNAGMTLAGLVIELAAQRPLAELATERVFAPLGMTRSSLTLAAARAMEAEGDAPLAVPHTAADRPGRGSAINHYGVAEWPAAQLRSSAVDLGRFLAALSGGAGRCPLFRSAAAFELMLPTPPPPPPPSGLAGGGGGGWCGALAWWGVDATYGGAGPEPWRGGARCWSHGGFMEGVRTHAYLWPEEVEGAGCGGGGGGGVYCGAVVLTNGEACYGGVTTALKRLLHNPKLLYSGPPGGAAAAALPPALPPAPPPSSNSWKQHLQQMAHAGGWGLCFRAAGQRWGVEVRFDLGTGATFLAPGDAASASGGAAGTKQAQEAAAAAACGCYGDTRLLARHAWERQREQRAATTFDALFDATFHGRLVESSPDAWRAVRAELAADAAAGAPMVVGIDCEGTHTVPPSMVQVATRSLVVLEFPAGNGMALSAGLRELLRDAAVAKVFCDSTSSDKKCLSLPTHKDAAALAARADVVELEQAVERRMGKAGVARGLARVYGLATGQCVRKSKKGFWFFTAAAAQSRAAAGGGDGALRGLRDVPEKDQRYAGMDAWFTLKAHDALVARAL